MTSICQRHRAQIDVSTLTAPRTTGQRLKNNQQLTTHHFTVVPKKKENIA